MAAPQETYILELKMKILKAFFSVCLLTLVLGGTSYSNEGNAKHAQRLKQKKAAQKASAKDFLSPYFNLKDALEQQSGLQLGLDISYMAQRASPSGKQTALQGVYHPFATWTFFEDKKGTLQFNFSCSAVRYWSIDGAALGQRVAVAVPLNDNASNQNTFSQFSLTYAFAGGLDWLSLTAGQFPIHNFDGGKYINNQQTYLINYALSQNASSSYPSGSLGAYATVQAKANLSFSAGYQDAANISGNKIQPDTAFDNKYAVFANTQYTPEVKGLGKGSYLALVYYQPSVDSQPGESWGISLIAEHNLSDKWVAFAGANAISAQVRPIKQSYRAGAAYLDPFERNSQDAALIGAAYNRLSAQQFAPAEVKTGEAVLEAQYVYWPLHWLSVTPDIQVYPAAALSSSTQWVTVASLRINLSL